MRPNMSIPFHNAKLKSKILQKQISVNIKQIYQTMIRLVAQVLQPVLLVYQQGYHLFKLVVTSFKKLQQPLDVN